MKITLDGIAVRDTSDWFFISDNKVYSDEVLVAMDEILTKNGFEEIEENQKIKITIEI